MAGLMPDAGEQLRAVSIVRWRLLVNSLRSVRGRLNLVSRFLGGFVVTLAGLGGAFGLGATAWELTRTGSLEWLAVFFWIVFLFWQFFPVMATALTQTIDTSGLLRFPLTYRTYFLVRLVMGTLDIATALGLCWSAGLLVGISAAAPKLMLSAAVAVIAFVIFNLLLARMTFVWIEHWISRRRSREIMGLLFFVMMVGFQFIGPALGRYSHKPAKQRFQYAARLEPLQRVLPPGLCTQILLATDKGDSPRAIGALGLVLVYSATALGLLHVRLRQQYRGENPEGNATSSIAVPADNAVRGGWKVPFASAAVSAVFEKEMRYLSRSGPMLFTMIMPLVMIILLWGGRRGFLGQKSDFFFPIGAAYCLLVMTNVIYNSFGGDGGGMQLFLMAPVSFRKVVLGKNLSHVTVLLAEVLILWGGITLIYHSPPLPFMALTVVWYLFAAPLNFTVGNLMSVYTPKKIDYAIFGRQRASEVTIFVSLGVQVVIMGIGALAIYLGHHSLNYWLGTLVLGLLAVPSIAGYVVLMRRIDGVVMRRREVLAAELCKA